MPRGVASRSGEPEGAQREKSKIALEQQHMTQEAGKAILLCLCQAEASKNGLPAAHTAL